MQSLCDDRDPRRDVVRDDYKIALCMLAEFADGAKRLEYARHSWRAHEDLQKAVVAKRLHYI